MPEPTTPAEPQAGGAGDTSAPGGQTTTPTPQAGSGKQPLSADEYERKLAEANKEAAANRVELKKYKEAEEAAKLAAMGDLEKAQARADAAEKQIQQYKDQVVLEKVINAAHKKGIIDPELAALAVKGNLEFGDDGMPSNLDKALDDLIKAKPYLVPQAGEPAPAGPAQTANRAPAVPAMNPGRTSIQSPGQGIPGRIPRITDPDLWKR